MRNNLSVFLGAVLALVSFGIRPAKAQTVVKLNPVTVTEFDRYANSVEAEFRERWNGKKNLLSVEDTPADKQKVLDGEFLIRTPSIDSKPQSITDGLIHDWVGTVYIPHTDVKSVIEILKNFDNHKKIYPEIADSKTVRQDGNRIVGYWRVEQRKGLVPIVLEVEQEAFYKELSPGKWICQAYARNITEIDTGLFGKGHRFPSGEGHGYMWRMYAYWTLEEVDGGVLGECRTLSLSRSIPQAIAWAVAPYVAKAPQESLISTLKQTRNALQRPKPHG